MYNHYVKIKRLTETYPDYQILLINKPTTTKRFNGELNYYNHYYRLVDSKWNHIKYGKFQQLDKLAKLLDIPIEQLEDKIIT